MPTGMAFYNEEKPKLCDETNLTSKKQHFNSGRLGSIASTCCIYVQPLET